MKDNNGNRICIQRIRTHRTKTLQNLFKLGTKDKKRFFLSYQLGQFAFGFQIHARFMQNHIQLKITLLPNAALNSIYSISGIQTLRNKNDSQKL